MMPCVGPAGIWTAWLLLLQLLLIVQVAVLRKVHLQPYAKAPAHSWQRMWAESALGYLGWAWPLGLVSAWINPGHDGGFSWSFSCPNLLLVGYYAAACTILYDIYAFPLHKWMHENKTAFRLMHRKHHGESTTGLAYSQRLCCCNSKQTGGADKLAHYQLPRLPYLVLR